MWNVASYFLGSSNFCIPARYFSVLHNGMLWRREITWNYEAKKENVEQIRLCFASLRFASLFSTAKPLLRHWKKAYEPRILTLLPHNLKRIIDHYTFNHLRYISFEKNRLLYFIFFYLRLQERSFEN